MKRTIPNGTTAKQVIEGVNAKAWSKATAAKFLAARIKRDIDAGRLPKAASRKALEELGGDVPAFTREAVTTRSQRRKAHAAAKAPAAAKAKPAKRTRRKAAKPQPANESVSIADVIAQVQAGAFKDADPAEVQALFVAIAQAAK